MGFQNTKFLRHIGHDKVALIPANAGLCAGLKSERWLGIGVSKLSLLKEVGAFIFQNRDEIFAGCKNHIDERGIAVESITDYNIKSARVILTNAFIQALYRSELAFSGLLRFCIKQERKVFEIKLGCDVAMIILNIAIDVTLQTARTMLIVGGV